MSTFTDTIQVSPLVRKFLSVHYAVEPFILSSKNNPFGAFLLNSLDRYPSKQSFKEYERFTEKLTVSFTWHQVERQFYCRSFNQYQLVAFNDFVKQTFLQQATREIVVRVETGEKVIRAAELILARYKLTEDDLAIDTLMRYYRAYKDSIFGRVEATWKW